MRTQSRLNAAIDMIADRRLKLSEIAENCGFSSYIHFLNAFKKAFGTAPSEYRRMYTKTEGNRNEGISEKN